MVLGIGLDDLKSLLAPISADGSSLASPLAVVLDTGEYGGRTVVEVWVKSSGAAEFAIYGSRNGTKWHKTDTITLSAAGESHKGYFSAYRYVKVETTAANDNEIEIVAAR